jgi:hypothetical protein
MRLGYRNSGPKLRVEARKLVARVALRHGALRDALEDLGDVLLNGVRETFKTEGDGTWPKLQEATIRAKGHSKILVDSHQLYEAIRREVWTKSGGRRS